MTSTQAKPSPPAKASTCSRDRSPRMALTKPSCMAHPQENTDVGPQPPRAASTGCRRKQIGPGCPVSGPALTGPLLVHRVQARLARFLVAHPEHVAALVVDLVECRLDVQDHVRIGIGQRDLDARQPLA